MAMTTYRPRNLLGQLQREMGGLFENPLATANFGSEEWSPAVDIKETDQAFVIHADLPGVKADDIEVIMEEGVLTIKGERESTKEEEKENYKRVERFKGSFMRRFTLPDIADSSNVSAKTKEGVLELVIPKVEKAKPQKISVQSESE